MPSGENVSTGALDLSIKSPTGTFVADTILLLALEVSKILGLLRVGGRCEEEHR
jgi:hypothetical protein